MDTYTVEFRIKGPALIPSDVSSVLGLAPSQTRERSANDNSKRHRNPFWAFDGVSSENKFVEQDWNSLEEGLTFLLEKLLPKRELIRSNFGEYKMFLWCGYFKDSFDGGPSLSANLLTKLAEFGVELIVKVYQHDE